MLRAVIWRRLIIVTILGLAILAALAWAVASRARASIGYDVIATFDVLPADDSGLASWLRSQPGVIERTVHVAREGHEVRVILIMTQNLLGKPNYPPINDAAAKLGYRGARGFHDAR